VEARKHVTVVGGGIAGLKAAKDLAARGIQVALVEKTPFLGGWAASWDRVSPGGEKVSDLITELTDDVLHNPRIEIHNCSRINSFEGYVGNFKLGIKRQSPQKDEYREEIGVMSDSGKDFGEFIPKVGVCPGPLPETGEDMALETGVIVLATGFKTYTPRRGEYGYADFAEVITLPDLINIIRENREKGGGETLEVNGRKIKNMAMIHCVGSRQIPGIHEEDEERPLNEYCSRVCCSVTLHAAGMIREAHPGTRVFDFYRDIRTYGRGQEEVYENASKSGVVFFRFESQDAPVVSKNSGDETHPLLVTVKDTLTFGEEIEAPVDLVVLAVGMEPRDVSDLIEMMKLSAGPDRFLLEVHPKLRPVELAATGILLAGTCQAPFDMGEACAAASAAAVKASSMLSSGFVELDPFIAEIDLERCKGTGACVDACLNEGALQLVDMEVDGQMVKRVEVNAALCEGCGACTAVCPENAISISGWALEQYEDMVDMIVSDQLAA
jgi:heterodisulfide reductase subunit A